MLFNLLFIVSLVALIIGLIKLGLLPSFLQGRKKIPLILGGSAFIFLVIGSLFTSRNIAQKNETGSTYSPTPVYFVFDVLSIVGKNIDEVRIVLGEPDEKNKEPSDLQIKQGVSEWQNTYTKEGRKLVVTYNPETRKVKDLFVGKKAGDTNENFLKFFNLNEKDSRYTIGFVQASQDPSSFTGVKITSQ